MDETDKKKLIAYVIFVHMCVWHICVLAVETGSITNSRNGEFLGFQKFYLYNNKYSDYKRTW